MEPILGENKSIWLPNRCIIYIIERSYPSQLALEKANKNLLDKASLDIAVSKSNLDSINIELTDTQQTINWLEKSVQEIQNQLDVLSIFGLKVARNDIANVEELRSDLTYQKKILALEKVRVKYLEDLQSVSNNIVVLRNDSYNRVSTLLKSSQLLHLKQQQVKDELAYQEQQNLWLQELNVLYGRLAKIDPSQSREAYAAVERDIFYANESANFAYIQSLLARYKDQIQQMKLAILRGNSISLLNEISDQVQTLRKQITRLDVVLKSRIDALTKHISYLAEKKKNVEPFQLYLRKLSALNDRYKTADTTLGSINRGLSDFRLTLEQAMQMELSSRSGFETFGFKTVLDIGKEMLLVPALTFQVVKSLSSNLAKGLHATGLVGFSLFTLAELVLVFAFFSLRKLLSWLLLRPLEWDNQININWLFLQWLRRNLLDLFVISNAIGILFFFDVPLKNFTFIISLSLVWLVFKSILIIARICLVETTHDTAGHDMKLYRRLKWITLIGGVITGLTVFVHLLPLIYELNTLCDRLFLLLLLVVSLLLLRSSDVVQNLILMHMESEQRPYLRKSIRLLGVLIPLLILGNSVVGLFGFVNLIMTVSWFEGIFLIVLIGYLLVRGLLSQGMEQLFRLVIQHVNNGWLWTEAFLKPIDTVLRITLFLMAWVVLFLLSGVDKQSPIVERLTRVLHYQLVNVLNTSITPISVIELAVVIAIFYWSAKWAREFVYRMLSSRTQDMGIRNSIAILSQYSVIILGVFICLRVLGIDLRALAFVASMFAFGIGLGLRDLANNFACGFLILFERPLRVGDIVNINGIEGDVTHIGSRAVTVRTWDCMELVVPNTEIFNKSFTNWTAKDDIVRSVTQMKISRYDDPHKVKAIIQNVLLDHRDVLKEPSPEIYLKEMNDTVMTFELRYYVNIRQIKSRTSVMSAVLMKIWEAFTAHGIKPPYPQHEIFLRSDEKPRAFGLVPQEK